MEKVDNHRIGGGQFLFDWLDRLGFGDREAVEELIGLEDGHVSR